MNSLEKLRSNVMRGNWNDVFETYKREKLLRMAKITAIGDTVLHMAVFNGRREVAANMVDFLVQEETSLDQISVVVTVDRDGEERSWNMNTFIGVENDRKNTPLHLAAKRGRFEICKKIGDIDPSLVVRRNNFGETPLFLAALNGKEKVFLWLHYLYVRSRGVSSTNFSPCIRDNGDTILHCAIAQGHIDVAIEIVHLYKDYMKEMMMRNKEGLSPLHLLASKRSAFKTTGLLDVPFLFIPIYWLVKVEEKNQATELEELQKKTAEADELEEPKNSLADWCIMCICSPLLLSCLLLAFFYTILMLFLMSFLLLILSDTAIERWLRVIPRMSLYAIKRLKQKHTWYHQIMTKLLQNASDEEMSQIISRKASDPLSISLQTEKDKGITNQSPLSGTMTIETPLMIAVKNGVMEMVEKIVELFPLRITDVNDEGKTIFLLAVEYRQVKVCRFLWKQEWVSENLFSEVDKEGNSALHLAARVGLEPDWHNPEDTQLSMGTEMGWFEFVKNSVPKDLLERCNRKMETPEDIFRESHKEFIKSEGEWVAKTSKACSVVSTLVVSVAFATRTNIPGGYEDSNGYAVLRNRPTAFKTFKDSSFAALLFSLISTICFLSIVASRYQSSHSRRFVPSKFYCGVYFMFASIVCLWISFCAADFFMLHDHAQKLHKALPTYIVLSSGFIIMVASQFPTFLGPKLSRFWLPTPRQKEIRPIEYRMTKNKDNSPDSNPPK